MLPPPTSDLTRTLRDLDVVRSATARSTLSVSDRRRLLRDAERDVGLAIVGARLYGRLAICGDRYGPRRLTLADLGIPRTTGWQWTLYAQVEQTAWRGLLRAESRRFPLARACRAWLTTQAAGLVPLSA